MVVTCIAACAASGAMYKLISILTGCGCLYSCFYRSKLRQQYTLEEKPCGDCLVHWCCEPCALCEEYRELKSRGFDMTIGKICTVPRRSYLVLRVHASEILDTFVLSTHWNTYMHRHAHRHMYILTFVCVCSV